MLTRSLLRCPLAVLLAWSMAAALPAQQPTRPAPANAAVSPDEQAIRQGVVAFVEQYNAHKADAVAALFAADARMIFRDGTEVNGRDQIKQAFEEGFAASPKGSISVVVDSIRFLTPDVAVEEGSTSMFPDGDTLTAKSRYTVVHLKRDGRWLMQSARVVEEESLSAYGELAPLEWLVGDWIDEGRTENVEATFSWDENKSFLLEEFQVVRGGDVVLKGTQRIGWDPQTKQIRSWTFDSAGGFGEAVWTPVDGGWVVKAKAVTADGTSASATRTLTRPAQDRVIWTATDRLAGDERLDDLAVTMVRKPPQPAGAE
jgi:uncharacterized protein (TIGR02246 family)